MKKIFLYGATLTMLTTGINAACGATACTGKIETLYMTAGGTLYVGTDGDEKALNCAGGPGDGGVANVYMSLKEGDIGKNAMYSLLLTAKTTGKSVTIRVDEGSTDCRVLYIRTN